MSTETTNHHTHNKKSKHLAGLLLAVAAIIIIVIVAIYYISSLTPTAIKTVSQEQNIATDTANTQEELTEQSQNSFNEALLTLADATNSDNLAQGLGAVKNVANNQNVLPNFRAQAIETLTRKFYISFDKEVYMNVMGKYPQTADDYSLTPAFEVASNLHPKNPIIEYSLALGYAQRAASSNDGREQNLNLSKTHIQNGDDSIDLEDQSIYKPISTIRKLKTLYYYSKLGIDVSKERAKARAYLTEVSDNYFVPEKKQAKLYLMLDSLLWKEQVSAADKNYWKNPSEETKASDAYALYKKVQESKEIPADLYEAMAIKLIK